MVISPTTCEVDSKCAAELQQCCSLLPGLSQAVLVGSVPQLASGMFSKGLWVKGSVTSLALGKAEKHLGGGA